MIINHTSYHPSDEGTTFEESKPVDPKLLSHELPAYERVDLFNYQKVPLLMLKVISVRQDIFKLTSVPLRVHFSEIPTHKADRRAMTMLGACKGHRPRLAELIAEEAHYDKELRHSEPAAQPATGVIEDAFTTSWEQLRRAG